MSFRILIINLSVLATKRNTFGNSVDPVEMAHIESSPPELQYLPFSIGLLTNTPI